MPTVKLYAMSGAVVGETELSDAVFGVEPNKNAMFEAVKNHLANRRQGTQSALTRAEVSGGGIKPYKQKGTGRARQGSTRAPQYTHGGIVFAPKPRDYSYSLNKKHRRLALRSALSQKVLDGNVYVVDGLKLDAIKTKSFVEFLDKLGVSGKALVVTPEVSDNIVKSARNIPGVTTTIANILSTYEIVNGGAFIVDRAAVSVIEEVWGK
ncbi:MAG: 50S ribosomal protein L4 [Oscillospiraceae bacterium]|jgi:large subunit ribosomal protein L4|nr:50S ribosomal protein L4 [Oscillospiraceae bacterium]